MKKVFRWIGIGLGSLIGLILLAAAAMFFVGSARFKKTYDFPASNITLPTDEASLENGKHRVDVLCAGCHGADLSGVEDWFNAGPLGTADSANLTSGEGGFGREASSVEDYVRAIRHGIDPEGKPIFMPAVVSTANLSDEDLAAIIAYVQSLPPVDHVTKGQKFTPLAKIMLAAGMLGELPVESVSHENQITAPAKGVSEEYGGYLVDTNDCRICHGPNLNGGPFPNPAVQKISRNLTPGGEMAFWTEDLFITALRTGTTPSGYVLDNEYMPWNVYRKFSDDELKAIWLYLQSIPAETQYTE